MDGDADRIAIVDERGEYISDQRHPAAALLVHARGARRARRRGAQPGHHAPARPAGAPPWARSATKSRWASSTSSAAMVEHDALLGGESSGGLTIRGHILGKDGIFASALVVEMLARTGKKISQLRQTVYELTGRLYQLEETLARHAGDAHRRAPDLARGAAHPRRRLPGGQDLAHGRHQAVSGERQLGAAALFRHRAGPAPDRRKPTHPRKPASCWTGSSSSSLAPGRSRPPRPLAPAVAGTVELWLNDIAEVNDRQSLIPECAWLVC